MAVVASYLLSGALFAVFVIVVVKLLQMVYNRRILVSKYKRLPQDPANPIFGHLLQYPGTNDLGLAYQRQKSKEYPRFMLVWLGYLPMVVVCHPDTTKIILKSSEPKAHTYRLLNSWIGDGLLKSNGSKWARNRRLLTPAFHFDILKGYLKLKNTLSNDLLGKFEDAADGGHSVNVFDCISMFTLDVILQCAMSYQTGCQKAGEKHPYILAVNRIGERLVKRFLQPWFHSDLLYFMTPAGMAFSKDCNFVHQVAEEIISNRRKELENSLVGEEKTERTRKYQDFLDTLITARDDEGNGLTDQEIRDEVDTFLFEGYDTTASAISWSLYSIAEHQDVQRRIQTEVDGLFAGRENDCLLWDDLNKLPYLTMVIKESMRLHSPVPFIMRQLTKDTVIDNCTIPKGTAISISIYRTHHNPFVWEDSMRFDPERFSPENSQDRDPFAFIPFSAGSRNCIGQNFAMDEIKVAIARILHRYTVLLDPSHPVGKLESLVIKAQNDIKLLVKPRLPVTKSV